MVAFAQSLSPVHYMPQQAEPVSVPMPRGEVLVDERLFGAEAARALRAEDSAALTAVSCILFVIVSAGCLLMLGSVVYVLM